MGRDKEGNRAGREVEGNGGWEGKVDGNRGEEGRRGK